MNKLEYILLIDDSDADNHFHKLIIGRSGIKCKLTSISSSHDALELLQNGISAEDSTLAPLPQVVFLDINMPRMNGWSFLEEYGKLNESQKGTAVIVMLTTSLNPDDLQQAKKYGEISEFRNKPLSQAIMMDIISRHFPELL